MNKILEIEDLRVKVGDRMVLDGVNLSIEEGMVHVIFGPNGSGKTTLVGSIVGLPQYERLSGDIRFMGKSILSLPTHERARLGIGLAFQHPPAIRGLTPLHLFRALGHKEENFLPEAQRLNLVEHLEKGLNKGLSGGEIKRSEILQLKLIEPSFVILDEPESGVDFENIMLLSTVIREMLEKDKPISRRKKSGLIITHTGFIIQHVEADVGHVILKGKILCSGNPHEILETVREKGFEDCVKCFEEGGRKDGLLRRGKQEA